MFKVFKERRVQQVLQGLKVVKVQQEARASKARLVLAQLGQQGLEHKEQLAQADCKARQGLKGLQEFFQHLTQAMFGHLLAMDQLQHGH